LIFYIDKKGVVSMPYSAKKILEKAIDKKANKSKQEFIEIAMKAKTQTFKDLYKETSAIFDNCIDQYYQYQTTSYYRHNTGIGSGTGLNLYRANEMKHIRQGVNDSLILGWSGENMATYKSVDADYVMDNVAKGIRGMDDPYMKYCYKQYDNHWSATVQSRYFGVLTGTMNDIFYEIEKKWNDVSGAVFTKHFMSLYKDRKIKRGE